MGLPRTARGLPRFTDAVGLRMARGVAPHAWRDREIMCTLGAPTVVGGLDDGPLGLVVVWGNLAFLVSAALVLGLVLSGVF